MLKRVNGDDDEKECPCERFVILERAITENREALISLSDTLVIKLDDLIDELKQLRITMTTHVRDLALALSGKGMMDVKAHLWIVGALIAFFFLHEFGLTEISKLLSFLK